MDRLGGNVGDLVHFCTCLIDNTLYPSLLLKVNHLPLTRSLVP